MSGTDQTAGPSTSQPQHPTANSSMAGWELGVMWLERWSGATLQRGTWTGLDFDPKSNRHIIKQF